jgi:hypothetical protein
MLTRLTIATILVTSSLASAAPDDGTVAGIDLPAADTTAKKDEYVLTVNKRMYERYAKAPQKEGVIFYSYKVIEPGPTTTKFKAIGSEDSAPNLLVIPIPKGGKAKVGDIVLTWWQSGSGMQRAIVMSAKDPTRPVVRYLDLDYDNPAKGGKDRKTPIGQMEEELEPDSFVKIDKPFQPGTTAACGGKQVVSVIRVSGDKVLVTGFMGKLAVHPKADCVAMPLKPKLKVGQTIRGKWVSSIESGTVTKIDAKIGRVWVKWKGMGDREEALAYGDVIDKL